MATGYIGTVQFTSSDSQAALPANYTITPGGPGNAPSRHAQDRGTQSITATDTSTFRASRAPSQGSSSSAAAPVAEVTGFPTVDTAGATADVTVTAYDAYGNVATGYTGHGGR